MSKRSEAAKQMFFFFSMIFSQSGRKKNKIVFKLRVRKWKILFFQI